MAKLRANTLKCTILCVFKYMMFTCIIFRSDRHSNGYVTYLYLVIDMYILTVI